MAVQDKCSDVREPAAREHVSWTLYLSVQDRCGQVQGRLCWRSWIYWAQAAVVMYEIGLIGDKSGNFASCFDLVVDS